METIKNLSVQVTFTLNFEKLRVPEQLRMQLMELYNEGKTLSNDNPNIEFEEVWDWLSEQISYHKGADYFECRIDWMD